MPLKCKYIQHLNENSRYTVVLLTETTPAIIVSQLSYNYGNVSSVAPVSTASD